MIAEFPLNSFSHMCDWYQFIGSRGSHINYWLWPWLENLLLLRKEYTKCVVLAQASIIIEDTVLVMMWSQPSTDQTNCVIYVLESRYTSRYGKPQVTTLNNVYLLWLFFSKFGEASGHNCIPGPDLHFQSWILDLIKLDSSWCVYLACAIRKFTQPLNFGAPPN